MFHTMRCVCSNISVTGCIPASKRIPMKLSGGKTFVGSEICSSFAIKSKAIEVKDINRTNLTKEHNGVCIVTCRNCGQSINFIDTHICGYAVFNSDTKKSRRKSHENLNAELSNDFQKYLNIQRSHEVYDMCVFNETDVPYLQTNMNTNEEEQSSDFDIDESDFELMFSGKDEPFIGAFNDQYIHYSAKAIII